MKREHIYLVVLSFLLILYCVYYKSLWTRIYLDNGRSYLVSNKGTQQEKIERAEKIDDIHEKLIKIGNHLTSRYSVYTPYEKKIVRRYLKVINYKDLIYETVYDKLVTYSVMKKQISLCLKGEPDVLLFVVLHEITHCCSEKYITDKEHATDEEFNFIFKFLLNNAIDSGVYENTVIEKVPYCDIEIKGIKL